MSDLIPRLSEGELSPDLATLLRPRVERLGYLGEFFQCAGHQPWALMSFLAFTEDLKRALPDNLTEVVALTVSTTMDSTYERVQHEHLSLKLGFSEQWIREVLARSPHQGMVLTSQERAIQALTLAVIDRRGHACSEELQTVVAAVGHERAVAILMLIGRYVTHALIVNCLGLAPPVTSPLPH